MHAKVNQLGRQQYIGTIQKRIPARYQKDLLKNEEKRNEGKKKGHGEVVQRTASTRGLLGQGSGEKEWS